MNTQATSTDPKTLTVEERLRNRRRMKIVQLVSWTISIVILAALLATIVQAVNTGDALPLWTVIGIVIVFVIIIGLVVTVAVYQGVVKSIGPLDFRPTARVVGQLRTENQSIEAGVAQSLQTEIELIEGVLQLTGGTRAVMDATYTFDDADWRAPIVTYDVDETGLGHLIVKQQASRRPAMRPGRNEWAIRLNDDLPTDLRLKFSAGKADLKLGGMALSQLNILGGVGELTVDLSGEWQRSLHGTVKGGIGRTTLRLPDHVGVRVEAMTGLGKTQPHNLHWNGEAYVNTAYGQSEVTLDLLVESGVGQIVLE